MTRWQRFLRYINAPVTFRRRRRVDEVVTASVILLISYEDGNIVNSFVEGEGAVGGYAIRIKDFPLNQGVSVSELRDKKMNWKEFPVWRKQQFTQGVVELDWGQIKGYLG